MLLNLAQFLINVGCSQCSVFLLSDNSKWSRGRVVEFAVRMLTATLTVANGCRKHYM